MKLGDVQVDMTPESAEFKVGEETITIHGVPNTPAMQQRAVRRARPAVGDRGMVDVISALDTQAEQLVEVIKGWDGIEDGCNNATKRQFGLEYPVTASEIIDHYNELYERRLKEREEAQGN